MKNIFLVIVILITGVLAGCSQGNTSVGNSQQKTSFKNKNNSSTLGSEVGTIAKALDKKITKSQESVNKKTKENKMDNENNKKDVEKLPIDMELAKTCTKATIVTNLGEIEIKFFNNQTPLTVANFCTLAKKNFYDNLTFHRVIKNFMIQAGDPNGDGTGGPGYSFKDEIGSENHNDKYTIAMANAGPNTNGSQFFINTKNNNFLDSKHTVFGKIIKGQEIVDKIENVETGLKDKPVQDVVIKDVKISEDSK